MSAVREWWSRARLRTPAEDLTVNGHAVHVYVDEATLLDRLEAYITEAWLHGQRTVVFAQHDRIKELRLRLASWHMDEAIEAHDATWALDQVLRRGVPSQELFDNLLRHTLGRYEPGTVRLYSELVATLWRRGEVPAALSLQAMWHEHLLDNPVPRLSVYARDPAVDLPSPRVGREVAGL
jgi:hypothetical protein